MEMVTLTVLPRHNIHRHHACVFASSYLSVCPRYCRLSHFDCTTPLAYLLCTLLCCCGLSFSLSISAIYSFLSKCALHSLTVTSLAWCVFLLSLFSLRICESKHHKQNTNVCVIFESGLVRALCSGKF